MNYFCTSDVYVATNYDLQLVLMIMIRGAPAPRQDLAGTVSFHNFESQNFKLSVSNPKSKYVAYVSVLSQISSCQGLGRKNKHEVLKTDRTFHAGCM